MSIRNLRSKTVPGCTLLFLLRIYVVSSSWHAREENEPKTTEFRRRNKRRCSGIARCKRIKPDDPCLDERMIERIPKNKSKRPDGWKVTRTYREEMENDGGPLTAPIPSQNEERSIRGVHGKHFDIHVHWVCFISRDYIEHQRSKSQYFSFANTRQHWAFTSNRKQGGYGDRSPKVFFTFLV